MENREKMAFTEKNYKLLLISIAIVIVGLLLMVGGGAEVPTEFNEEELFSFRRITLAPILVMAGFGFGVYAVLHRPKESEKEVKEDKKGKK